MLDSDRARLRRQLRHERRSLTAAEQRDRSEQVYRRVVSQAFFHRARRLAFYFANDGEVDPLAILLRAWQMSKHCYLPVLSTHRPDKVCFAPFRPGDKLVPNRWGILEPALPVRRLVAAYSLDLVLVPLVGFDAACNRLGMGKGFYDRTFAYRQRLGFQRPRLIGLAYEQQKVDRLPVSDWDVPLEAVVTETTLYRRSNSPLPV
ncbi:MAG: 5-formyltetrahydrofolate cyclo-ligase [Gammaproteobacteria bacterium]|nr:5-formyltetrahydrofolate cyclo-ligase [Pseudomonadales bacterium]MCP5348134.1 5-formyltetrahydrofolate cyclo-ligase [Pseudomonadales bacterium]